MPTYEFQCNDCNNKFEVFTSISDRDKVKCPKCGSKKLTPVLGGFFIAGAENKNTSSSTCPICNLNSCNINR